ncbi:hypothetical protein BJ944DRAFT_256436 [Cunninghamella echinulata]|nr:hypothetical protein BJ944DRAFT_256436 [Cunninghamella echinulata]
MTTTSRDALKSIGIHLQTQPSHHIPSPPTQPRRACVAAILRWKTNSRENISPSINKIKTIEDFLELPWVKGDTEGGPELLFMQRASRDSDRWSGHVAFIGGKNEPGESDEETVIREVKEEIGLNLGSDSFIKLGQLDDREIISTLNKQLLMILVPFVYLQVVPHTPTMELEKDEVASVECNF